MKRRNLLCYTLLVFILGVFSLKAENKKVESSLPPTSGLHATTTQWEVKSYGQKKRVSGKL